MEDENHLEPALAFTDPEEEIVVIKQSEFFFPQKYTSPGNYQSTILFLAQSMTRIVET